MAVREILQMGHPALYRVAESVADPSDPKVAAVVRDLQDTLLDIHGGAIAAPQIRENMRLVVFRLSGHSLFDPALEDKTEWTVMINPVLTPRAKDQRMGWERCLSIPGLHGKVPRYTQLIVSYVTPEGNSLEHEVRGAHAAILQHECDHLDGILYPMRMTDLSLLEFNTTPCNLARDLDQGEESWPTLRATAEAWRG